MDWSPRDFRLVRRPIVDVKYVVNPFCPNWRFDKAVRYPIDEGIDGIFT